MGAIRRIGLVTWAIMALAGCSESLDEAAARKIVDEVNARAIDAANAGDLDKFLEAYADDPWVLPPGEKMKRGLPAAREFWEGVFAQNLSDLKLETLQLEVAQDFFAETGRLSFVIRPDGQEATRVSGKFVVIWKPNADDSWGWSVDIFNNDPPPRQG